MADLKFHFHSQKNSPEETFIQSQLAEYNKRFTGPTVRLELTLTYKNQDGEVVAGLCGYTNWGWLYTRLLWVSDQYQRQGLGGQLMSAAEAEAKKRGCHSAWIDTFSFQARQFYEKIGYQVFGELPNFPGEHVRYFLKKELR